MIENLCASCGGVKMLSHHEAHEGHEGSDIDIFKLLNFVLFVAFMVKFDFSSLVAALPHSRARATSWTFSRG